MVGHVNLLRTPKMVLLIDTLKEEAQLHRKLNIFAQVVEKLLSLEPMPREKVAKKLNQLEVVILEVDALAFPELVKEWKKKLESYWRILIPTTDKSEQSRFEAFLASLNSKRNHHSHLSRISWKELIPSYLEHMFNQIIPISYPNDEEVTNLVKQLTIVMAKAIKLIFPLISLCTDPTTELFQSLVFKLAFPKLPETKQGLFNSSKFNHSLRSLLLFLRHHIISHQSTVTNQAKSSVQQHQISIPPLSSSAVYCKYCQQVGHQYGHCPIIGQALCFKCFQLGHTIKICTNEQMIDLDWLETGIIQRIGLHCNY